MVQRAVRAWQIMKCIQAQDIDGLKVLPQWACDATMDHRLFMTNEDMYTGLWVQYPLELAEVEFEVHGLPEDVDVEFLAFRAAPNDILVYRKGDKQISVLAERK
jgi:hypothetical protein